MGWPPVLTQYLSERSDRANPFIYSILYIFNPFHTFGRHYDLDSLVYDFEWNRVALPLSETISSVVLPIRYMCRTKLVLPLAGPILVYDGNDFYSHHRRVDILHPVARQMGLSSNSSRYAYDLCVINNDFRLFDIDPQNLDNWYSHNANVYSPADGVVVAARDSVKDNSFANGNVIPGSKLSLADPGSFSGNYIIIDHENGEYSLLAHFKKGSLRVKTGDRVKQGQLLGSVGFSGSTGNVVHLHYELRNSSSIVAAEGLPSQFLLFTNVNGLSKRTSATIETGEIVKSDFKYQGR
ncbi:MAG TPA: M23 family metallopeptidase [Chryseosolibacter sp.]